MYTHLHFCTFLFNLIKYLGLHEESYKFTLEPRPYERLASYHVGMNRIPNGLVRINHSVPDTTPEGPVTARQHSVYPERGFLRPLVVACRQWRGTGTGTSTTWRPIRADTRTSVRLIPHATSESYRTISKATTS